jgi:hypothetical protein
MNFAVAKLWLKETLPPSNPEKGTILADNIDKPLPFRALLTPPVVISIINQGWISFIGLGRLFSLHWMIVFIDAAM